MFNFLPTVNYQINFNSILNSKENRIKFIALLFIILYLLILSKIIFIYSNNEDRDRKIKINNASINNSRKYNILDRNGQLLATTIKTYNFYVSPSKTVFPEDTIKKINKLFINDTLSNALKQQIRSKQNRLVLIKRELTEEQKNIIIASGIEAAEFEKTNSRVYPYGNIFSHIVGYVNSTLEGVYGLERSFNEKLYYEDVITSLDARVQSILHFKLSQKIKEYNAKSGFALVLNIKNGEVLGSVSLPDFNPKNIKNPNGDNMKNIVFSETYNLGSVFKIVTLAMGLEHGIDAKRKFDRSKPIRVDRTFTLKDERFKEPKLNMSEILAFSSNVGSAKILEAVGIENQKPFFSKLGVFQEPNMELSSHEIANPIYKTGKWRKSMHYTTTYGYGISLSPIHFSNIMRTIVSTGTKGDITLIKDKKTKIHETILSSNTVEQMQEMLRSVIEIGTARRIKNINGYQICGKTSTTYKYDRDIKEWSKKKRMITFIGFFPCDEPKYLIYVGLDEPKPKNGTAYYTLQGGTVAAPLSAELISEIAPILNIKPDALNK